MLPINLIALVASLLAGHMALVAECADEPEAGSLEPAFPRLFNPGKFQGPISPRRVKIVTEIIGENARTTAEEYLDLDAGRAAFRTATTDANSLGSPQGAATQYQVIFSDLSLGQIFTYRPYSCRAEPMNSGNFQGAYQFSILIDWPKRKTDDTLRVFGVAGIWSLAASQPKTYSLASTVYSTRKDVYKVGHHWTFTSQKSKLEFKLSFIEVTMRGEAATKSQMAQEGNSMSLETVQVTSLDTGAVLQTFNVLSIDYEISADEENTMLRVPVGYGCKVDQDRVIKADQKERYRKEARLFSERLWSSSKVDLEVSATKIEPASGARSSDTIYLEVAHAFDKINGLKRKLSMTKVKSSTREIKTISNHAFNVKYTIDMQTSTCTMSHLEPTGASSRPAGETDTYSDDEYNDLHLQFSNGLKLSLEPDQMEYLLANSDGYVVVKEFKTSVGADEQQVTYTYLERTIEPWPFGAQASNKFARQVRTFVTQEPPEGSKKGWRPKHTRLESVTIWVFADKASESAKIESVYQMNVINHETDLRRWPDVPLLFDVSHECYLQAEDMHSGQDYAWVEFYYPLSSHQLDTLIEYETRLERELHDELTINTQLLTSFQVPQLELMFTDEGLYVRVLLIDMPSLHLMFEPFAERTITLDKGEGDQTFVTPDAKHCSKLCQQYSCKSMTYCAGSRSCMLGMHPVFASKEATVYGTPRLQPMKENVNCVTFSSSGGDFGPELAPGLTNVLSMMKHYNYDTEGMPEMPDDVDDQDEAKRLFDEYKKQVREYFMKKGMPVMVLLETFNNQLFALVPTDFLIEDDPFEKLGSSIIGAAQNEDQDELLHDTGKITDFFHEGLSMARFKFNAFHAGLKHKDKARHLAGLSYDQCALGCLDSKCGTFSYCPNTKECILTTFNLIAEASQENLVETNGECFISQRDFTKNFQLYPNVQWPARGMSTIKANSPSDCALACMMYDAYDACVSFEYCPSANPDKPDNNCYLQMDRHPQHIFDDYSPEKSARGTRSKSEFCDHYERSHLAEFNQIESTQFDEDKLAQLGTTTEYSGKTTLECADICLNQLDDCSAFQFCLHFSGDNTRMQECLMIRDKFSRATAGENGGKNELELVIDPTEHDSEYLTRTNKYLKYNNNCQVFALRANTAAGHLRDLAMGNTMTIWQKEELESGTVETSSSGHKMSWLKYVSIFASITIITSLVSLSVCWAYQRNELVRYQIDRFRPKFCF